MTGNKKHGDKNELFTNTSVPKALAVMAIPTIVSQLIVLIYNIADTWFIGRTGNPYMVASSSLVLTIFLMTAAIANLFGVGGGSLVVRLLGTGDREEAAKAASFSILMAAGSAFLFSVLCFLFMNPLLRLLGASDNTIGFARQYLLFVVVIGGLPTVLSNTMASLLRNVGYSREAGCGLGFGGLLNIALDPLFMFVLLPDGFQVMGAGLATMLSNMTAFLYFCFVYLRLRHETVLSFPRRMERLRKESLNSLFSVGVPAALSLLLFDLCNIVINRLSAGHGDIELAAIGIVLKVERLPLNVGIGICLGMIPLAAYNYARGDYPRMMAFFRAARTAGLVFAVLCVCLYRTFAARIMALFIKDAATVEFGTQFLRARCFATPFMFLNFHMVHFMQAIDRGKESFYLAVTRQLCLNIPFLFLLNHFFGMNGIIWTQVTADFLNGIVSYLLFFKVIRGLKGEKVPTA